MALVERNTQQNNLSSRINLENAKKAQQNYIQAKRYINQGKQIANRARDLTGGENVLSSGTKDLGLDGIPVIGDLATGLASFGDTFLNIFGYDPGLTPEEIAALKEKFMNESVEKITDQINSDTGIQLKIPGRGTVRIVKGKPVMRSYKMTKEQKKSAEKIKQAVNNDELVKQVEEWYQDNSTGYGTLAYKYKSGPMEGELINYTRADLDNYNYHMFGYPGHEFPLSTRLRYFIKFLKREKGITNPMDIGMYVDAYKKYVKAREG